MNSGSSKVPRYFRMLSEAGIRDVLLGLRKEKYYLKRRSGTQFVQEEMLRGKNIGMSGSIQTIFIISITCLSVATLVFILEVGHKNQALFKLCTAINHHCIELLNAMRICFTELPTLLRFTVERSNKCSNAILNYLYRYTWKKTVTLSA
jgi:hypothetical protein